MMRTSTFSFIVAITLLAATVLPGLVVASELQATPVVPEESPTSEPMILETPSDVPQSLQAASEFCLLQDGLLVERFPFVGTALDESLRLSGSRWFCEFTGGEGADPPTSRISIGLSTLYADGPTLATLAYLSSPPVAEVDDGSNLAVYYCADLGGSSRFGPDIETGGGWASDASNPATTSIGICVFPDGSAIDDWGLTYHANGTIRGTDLAKVLRFQPGDIPDFVFPVE